MDFVAEIPARKGSKRVKQKNLRLICGKPLIRYAIDAAKNARLLKDIYVNSDSQKIGEIAKRNKVKFYKRSCELASDTATSDDFNYDFMKNVKSDAVVMINPVSPLIEGEDIDNAIEYFMDNNLDTLISSKRERLQCFYKDKPLNFDMKGPLPRTQDIEPVNICVWSIAIWKKAEFVKLYEKKGYAVFSGKVGFFPLEPLKTVKISYEDDFRLAEALLKVRMSRNES